MIASTTMKLIMRMYARACPSGSCALSEWLGVIPAPFAQLFGTVAQTHRFSRRRLFLFTLGINLRMRAHA